MPTDCPEKSEKKHYDTNIGVRTMCNKTFLFILIQFIIIIKPCYPQGNWEQILPPYPTSNQLVSLDFIDEHTGLAVGEYGTIVKTVDGGESWKLIEISWLDYLLDIDFVNNHISYAVGQNGIIIKSTDGGESWEKQPVKYTNNLNRILFRDENDGWIIGEWGLLLHTSDGGNKWEQVISNRKEELKGIAFIDDSSLCIVGNDSTILLTNNEGKSWQRVVFDIDLSVIMSESHLTDVFFLNDTLGWIGGIYNKSKSAIILNSTDGGKLWNFIVSESVVYNENHDSETFMDNFLVKCMNSKLSPGIQQIYFKDIEHGLSLLDSKKHYHSNGSQLYGNRPFFTSDRGKSWICEMHGYYEYSIQRGRFCFLTDNKVINTCDGGEFRFSYDSGRSWYYPNNFQRRFRNIVIGNNGRILASKSTSDSVKFMYMYSNDFGKTWHDFTPQVYDSTGQKIDIQLWNSFPGSFIDDREILWTTHRYSQQIFKSTDYGSTWYSVRTGINTSTRVIHFLTPDTLIKYRLLKIGDKPEDYASELKFYYSFDGGRTVTTDRFPGLWNDATSPSSDLMPWETHVDKYIYDHYFFDGKTGFLVGSDGNIIKTTDTGRSWKSIYSGVVDDLFDIEFIDDSVGFVVGKFGRILKTEDRGETWRKTNSGTQENIFGIGFKNEYEGWVGTENGLRYTNNTGETWEGVSMRYQHGFVQYIEFDDYGNGYAFRPSPENFYGDIDKTDKIIPGGYNFLLYMKNDGTFIEDKTIDNQFPASITLQPNYPNPFNLSTKIVYQLPETGDVSLKVYNIQGQLVRTLVDEIQKSGEHTVLWDGLANDGVEVTSGVYFYRLESGKEVKTRKMVLLR
jgi:photosystem II stability/assembly factor-like uncharacterized protein